MDPEEELVVEMAPPNEGDDDDSEEENAAPLVKRRRTEELLERIPPENTEPLINLLFISDRNLHGAPGDFATATAHADDKITALLQGHDHLTRIQRIHELQDDRVTGFYNKAIQVIKKFSINQMDEERNKLAKFLKRCSESSGLRNEAIDVLIDEGEILDPLLAELVESWKPAAYRAIHEVHEPLFWLLGGALELGAQGCLIATCTTSNLGSVLEMLKKNWIVGRNYHDILWNLVIGSIMKSIETDDQQTKEEVEKVVRLLASISEIYVIGRVQDLLTGHTNDKCCVMFAFGWELRGKIEIVKNGEAYAKIEAANRTIKPDMLELFSNAKDQESRTVDSSTQTQPINTASRRDLSPDQPASKPSSVNHIEEFPNFNKASHLRRIEKLKIIRKYTYKDPDNLQKRKLNIRAISIKNEENELGEVIFYYLKRSEEPHTSVQSEIRQSYFDSQTDYQQIRWVEMCCVVLSTQPAHFYKRFDNIMATFQDNFDEQPQLLMCMGSNGLLEKLVEYLPHEDLRLIISKIRDGNGMTCMFHVNEYRSFVILYYNRVEDLYKLLSTRDSNGQTAVHVNAQPITQLITTVNSLEHTDDLYRLLSIQDNNRETALHVNTQPITQLLTTINTPERSHDLYVLLSIQNTEGRTALHVNTYSITQFIPTVYTQEHTDDLYDLLLIRDIKGQTALHTDRYNIPHLLTIKYTQEQANHVYKLLSVQDNDGKTALHVNTHSIDQLIDTIYTSENAVDLYGLLSIRDINGKTALHVNTQPITQLLSTKYTPEHAGELYSVLSISDVEGQTVLHIDRDNIPHLLTNIYTPKHADDLWKLLSIRDNNNQTALHVNPSENILHFLSTKIYNSNQADHLYELLSLRDNNGRTAVHVNRELITRFLAAVIYTPEQQQLFFKLISDEDNHNKTASQVSDERYFSNLEIQDENNKYFMRSPEVILIIYNSNNRPRAEEEAQTIYNACKSRYYWEVALERNKPEHEIIDLMKHKANNPNTKSLIVIFLSTGDVGTIDDCDGKPIKLSAIEAAMCSDILDGTPKILITQCNERTVLEADMKLNPYVPTHYGFCAVMSFVAEEAKHKQGFLLGRLAERMEKRREDTNIFKQLINVSNEMEKEEHPQTPIIMSTLDAEFCPPVVQL